MRPHSPSKIRPVLEKVIAEMLAHMTEAYGATFPVQGPEGDETLGKHLPIPWDINCGWCDEFADRVAMLMDGAESLWDDALCTDEEVAEYGIHAFVRYEGRYYDSECLDGVDDFRKLPIYRGFAGNPRPSSVEVLVCSG